MYLNEFFINSIITVILTLIVVYKIIKNLVPFKPPSNKNFSFSSLLLVIGFFYLLFKFAIIPPVDTEAQKPKTETGKKQENDEKKTNVSPKTVFDSLPEKNSNIEKKIPEPVDKELRKQFDHKKENTPQPFSRQESHGGEEKAVVPDAFLFKLPI